MVIPSKFRLRQHGDWQYTCIDFTIVFVSLILEKNIPKFVDFVLWGHEHENRIQLEFRPSADCFISQPGSTVPTSLCDGESEEKQVAILTVNQNKFKFNL